MTKCEDCGDECKRRFRCSNCNLLICGWCWNHVHVIAKLFGLCRSNGSVPEGEK